MNSSNLKVFLGCIPGTAKEDELLTLFSKFGEIREINLRFRKSDGKCAGFGYLICSNLSTFQRIIQTKNFDFKGRKIISSIFLKDKNSKIKAKNSLKKRKLLIKNISGDVDQSDLTRFFENFGNVEIAYIVKHEANLKKKPSKGSSEIVHNQGCVVFRDEKDAKKMLQIGNVFLKGRELKLKFPGQKKKKKKIEKNFENDNWLCELDDQRQGHISRININTDSIGVCSQPRMDADFQSPLSLNNGFEFQMPTEKEIFRRDLEFNYLDLQNGQRAVPHKPGVHSCSDGQLSPLTGGRHFTKQNPNFQIQEHHQNLPQKRHYKMNPSQLSHFKFLDPICEDQAHKLNKMSNHHPNHQYQDYEFGRKSCQANFPSFICKRNEEIQFSLGQQNYQKILHVDQNHKELVASIHQQNTDQIFGLHLAGIPKRLSTEIICPKNEPDLKGKNGKPYFCQHVSLIRALSSARRVCENHEDSNLRLKKEKFGPKKFIDSVKNQGRFARGLD